MESCRRPIVVHLGANPSFASREIGFMAYGAMRIGPLQTRPRPIPLSPLAKLYLWLMEPWGLVPLLTHPRPILSSPPARIFLYLGGMRIGPLQTYPRPILLSPLARLNLWLMEPWGLAPSRPAPDRSFFRLWRDWTYGLWSHGDSNPRPPQCH